MIHLESKKKSKMGIHDVTIAVVYGCPYKGCIEIECSENIVDFTWMTTKACASYGYVIACDYDLVKHAPTQEDDVYGLPWSHDEIAEIMVSR